MDNKYKTIQRLHEEKGIAVVVLCDIADVSRAAYYKWLKRAPSKREVENTELLDQIRDLQITRGGIYGYRQMTTQINRLHHKKWNEKRIRRLMKVADLQSVTRKKKRKYKPFKPEHVTDNLMNREFTAEAPNTKWVTDVTEMKYGSSQKAYLSAIRDLYDGSIVSHVLNYSNNNDLVFRTLDKATSSLEEGEAPLLQSDRGFQYTSSSFHEKLRRAGMTLSMSRVGQCIDNGPMESFWGTLKCEKYYLYTYDTFEELEKAIDEYIYYYNNERYLKKFNGLSPLEYRTQTA